jgi:putative transposase
MPHMKYDPNKHHRRSIRLRGYDYSQAGAYYITLVTQDRQPFFGDIANGEIRLNDAGKMVERWFNELPNKFPSVETDEYVIMPNHFHAIVVLVGANSRIRPDAEPDEPGTHAGGGTHAGVPLPQIVQWFKTMTTNEYIRGVKNNGWAPFRGKFWQRNYYEHIIRDDADLERIRAYISANPANWIADTENPFIQQNGKFPPSRRSAI